MDDGVDASERAASPPKASEPPAARDDAPGSAPPPPATCDSADKLLEENDSSQETEPAADGVAAEDVEMAPASAESQLRDADLSDEQTDVAMDGDATSATTSVEGKAEAAAVEAIVDEAEIHVEHPALNGERQWYGELPAFVRQAYGVSGEESSESSTADLVSPPCTNCLQQGRRALSSVYCIEEKCAFRNVGVCSECYREQHAGDLDRVHRLCITKACPQCHLARVEFWCTGCDLSFCGSCFVGIHSGIKKSSPHKPFKLYGTPGTMVVRAKWTPHYKEVVEDLRAKRVDALKTTASATKRSAVAGVKRKLPAEQEVICIDDDGSDPERDRRQPTPPPNVGVPPTVTASMLGAPIPVVGLPVGPQVYRALMPPPEIVASSGVSTPTTTSHAFFPSGASTPIAQPAMSVSQSGKSPNGMAWSAPTTPLGTSPAPPAAAPVTTLSNPALGGLNTIDQNPIEQVLFERLVQTDDHVHQTEQTVAHFNAQVVQASYRSVQTAHTLMEQLKQHQQRLQLLRTKRDQIVVQLVAQSKSLIAKVKLLRLDLLGDIPQVQEASYRHCTKLSHQIKEGETVVFQLNARMNQTLEQIGSVSSEVFHSTVSTLNSAIQSHEQDVLRFKDERENAIVRLVQYHSGIRDMLKRAVQQQQHIRHMQELQQRQQQQQLQQQLHQQQQPQPQQPVSQQAFHAHLHLQMLQKQQQFQQQLLQNQQQLLQTTTSLPEPRPHPSYSAQMQQTLRAQSTTTQAGQAIPMPAFLAAQTQHTNGTVNPNSAGPHGPTPQ